jgi:hypothetical protein
MLNRDEILKAADIKTVTVDVPEWGGVVCVKVMSGMERDAFDQFVYDSRGEDKKINLAQTRAKLCILTICDEKGNRIFGDDDLALVGSKSASAIDRIVAAARKLNALDGESAESLEKN